MESQQSLTQYKFPSRPNMKKKLPRCLVTSNMYKISLQSLSSKKKIKMRSWAIRVLPEVALDSRFFFSEIIKKHRVAIQSKIGFFMLSGQKLYSMEKDDNQKNKQLIFPEEKSDLGEGDHQLILDLNETVYDLENLSCNQVENLEVIKFLNLIMKSTYQRMNMYELGYNKKYYKHDDVGELTLGDWSFIILKGFKSSINLYERGLLINVDFNTRITRYYNLWEELNFFEESMGMSRNKIIEENIIGNSFILMHANHRMERIDKVDQKMRISDPFPNKKYSSYKDYYAKVYGFKLNDPNQLMCISFKKNYVNESKYELEELEKDKKGYFIMQENIFPSECLRPVGMLDIHRQDRSAMKGFAKHTQLYPSDRMDKNKKFIRSVNKVDPSMKTNSKKKFIDIGKEMRLMIDDDSGDVEGTILSYPALESGDGRVKPNARNGNYNLRNPVYEKNCQLANWGIVYDNFGEKNVDKVVGSLKKCSKAYAIRVKNPSFEIKVNSRNVNPDELLNKILKANQDVTMVLFIVSRNNHIYQAIKYVFAKADIPTQFFVNIGFKTNLSVYSKVLLQKVAKNNGVILRIENVFSAKKEHNMLVGIDVVNTRKGFLISIVASHDKNFTHYSHLVAGMEKSTKKGTRETMAEKISEMLVECHTLFKKENSKWPSNTIVYRIGSGNSVGLLNDLAFEAMLSQKRVIEEGCKETKFMYFGVSQKINERIFELDKRNGVRNPNGGLIVYDHITQIDKFEFYMVAQNVNQGSATPTNYFCVFNNTSIPADEIYKTTYYQTFNYSNWQGPIKIPAVAMYAKKQSELWASMLKKGKHTLPKLFKRDSPYYL